MKKFYQIKDNSLGEAGVKNYQELWDKIKGEYEGFQLSCHPKLKAINKDNFSLEAVFSTDSEDRHGDIVLQNWDLKNFKVNPVILNSHNYYDATEVIGRADKIGIKDKQLKGKIVFAVAENPKAKIIFDLYAGGFLNAFSVGFIVKQWDEKGTMIKSELLEISAVSVPANPEAVVTAKSMGIDVDQLYAKPDNGDDLQNKNNDGKDAELEGDDSKADGGKGEPEIKPNDGTDDAGKQDANVEVEAEKSVNTRIGESIKTIKQEKISALRKINDAIRLVDQTLGTHKSGDKVENNRLVNQAIRKLIKLKD